MVPTKIKELRAAHEASLEALGSDTDSLQQLLLLVEKNHTLLEKVLYYLVTPTCMRLTTILPGDADEHAARCERGHPIPNALNAVEGIQIAFKHCNSSLSCIIATHAAPITYSQPPQ